MAKYVKIENEDDIIEINENDRILDYYCWNCKWFNAPNGCNLFRSTVPFRVCDEWAEANDDKIESTQETRKRCCKLNYLKKINYLKECQKDISTYIDDILKLTYFDEEES